MKNKDLLLLAGLGLAVWYFSRQPMVYTPLVLPQSPVIGPAATPYAAARARGINGYERLIQRKVS